MWYSPHFLLMILHHPSTNSQAISVFMRLQVQNLQNCLCNLCIVSTSRAARHDSWHLGCITVELHRPMVLDANPPIIQKLCQVCNVLCSQQINSILDVVQIPSTWPCHTGFPMRHVDIIHQPLVILLGEVNEERQIVPGLYSADITGVQLNRNIT